MKKLSKLVAVCGVATVGIATVQAPVFGAPFTESQMAWAQDVDTVKNGETLSVNVKVNSNDTTGAAGEQDLTVVLKTTASGWKGIPNACDETSTLSPDRKTLTCVAKKVAFGTALQFQAELIASGTQGDTIVPTISVNGGAEQSLAPVEITTVKGVTLQSNYNADSYKVVKDVNAKGTFAVPFTISVPQGGEKLSGPITFDVTVQDGGSEIPASTNLVPATELGKYTYTGEPAPCGYIYPGTWSPDLPGTPLEYLTSQKFDCTMTPNGPSTWTVTITNYQADLYGKYDKNGIGGALARNDLPVINGAMLFTNSKSMFGASKLFNAKITTSNLKATTSSGEVLVDSSTNNKTSSIVVVGEGNWSGGFYRYLGGNILDGQGAQWSTEGKIAPGTAGWFGVNDERLTGLTADTYQTAGDCIIWDDKAQLSKGISGRSDTGIDAFWSRTGAYETPGIEYLYSDTAVDDLSKANCGTLSGWDTTVPTDATLSKVRGIRYVWKADSKPTTAFSLAAWLTPSATAKAGDRIWAAGQKMTDGVWTNSFDGETYAAVDGAKYAGTNYGVDTVTVTGGHTYARKEAPAEANVSAGDTVSWTVHGGFITIAPNVSGTLTLVDKVPEGLSIIPETITGGGVWDAASRTITWTDTAAVSNTDYAFTYRTLVQSTYVQKNTLTVKTQSDGVDPDPRFSTATATATVTPKAMGETVLVKDVEKHEFIVNGANTWKLSFTNKDVPQETWDIIDILPYNGDVNGSKFVGDVAYGDVTTDAGATVYWTDVAPSSIVADPADASNGALGAPSQMWSTTKPAHPTAVRIVGKNLASGASVHIELPFTVSGSADSNVYSNIAYAKATTTQLQMIRSAATTMLAEASQLQIDKKQVSVDKYGPGGTVTYQVTVKNNGQGTAHDVVVTDKLGDNLASAKFTDLQQGTSDGEVWKVGDVPAGATVTATVVATMSQDATYTKETVNTIIVENPSNPKGGDGCSANDTVDGDTDQCDVEKVNPRPKIDLTKTADKHTGLHAGDVVTYTFTVKNAGSLPLHDVKVSEKTFTGAGDLTDVTCPETVLDVAASMTCHATYTVQQADVDRAVDIDNTAEVVGFSLLGEKVTDEDKEKVTPEPAPPTPTPTPTPVDSGQLQTGIGGDSGEINSGEASPSGWGVGAIIGGLFATVGGGILLRRNKREA